MGTPALLSRFEQLAPTILFTTTEAAGRASELSRGLRTLTAVVTLGDGPLPAGLSVPVHRLSDMRAEADPPDAPPDRLPFNHPLFVLFTSGTTGPEVHRPRRRRHADRTRHVRRLAEVLAGHLDD
jgi:acetoacetyl-CoA synthetase